MYAIYSYVDFSIDNLKLKFMFSDLFLFYFYVSNQSFDKLQIKNKHMEAKLKELVEKLVPLVKKWTPKDQVDSIDLIFDSWKNSEWSEE